MSRILAGAAVGTAGTTAYLRPDIVLDLVKSATSPSKAEIQHLADLIEQLSKEVKTTSKNAVTIVHSDSSSGSSAYYIVVAAGVSGILYLALFRGWRLSDLCYVTQRTFRQGVSGLSAGIDALHARIADVKAKLHARLTEVIRKQDEAAIAQAATRAHLAEVGADVNDVRGQVRQVHAAVLDLDAALAQVGTDQRHALRGIYVLCKAVGELAAGSSIASKDELLEYTQSPVWQRIRPSGLEGILRDEDANLGSRPGGSYLLGYGNNGTGLLKSLPGGTSQARDGTRRAFGGGHHAGGVSDDRLRSAFGDSNDSQTAFIGLR